MALSSEVLEAMGSNETGRAGKISRQLSLLLNIIQSCAEIKEHYEELQQSLSSELEKCHIDARNLKRTLDERVHFYKAKLRIHERLFQEAVDKLGTERKSSERLLRQVEHLERVRRGYETAFKETRDENEALHAEITRYKGHNLADVSTSDLRSLRTVLSESTNTVTDELLQRSDRAVAEGTEEIAKQRRVIADYVECAICRQVPARRVSFSCGHTCCAPCYDLMERMTSEQATHATCHMCREPIDPENVRPLY